ncbi:MAG: hypothetical protein HEQ39_16515 [Rhizobacter sp.]
MSRNKQQGVVLYVALIVLVVMMAATVAILRNTSSSQNVAGNLGFKQNAVTASDLAVENAITWLAAEPILALDADNVPEGYFARWGGGGVTTWAFDPATFDWDANSFNITPAGGNDGTGNTRVRYVIHRMCLLAGSVVAPGQICSFADSNSQGSREAGNVGSLRSIPTQAFYRVTVQTTGPRGTINYSQAMLSIQ